MSSRAMWMASLFRRWMTRARCRPSTRLRQAGIKVITFDAPAPSSKALTYIGTVNEAAGYAGAEELLKIMKGEGEVAVLQAGLGAPNLNDRYKGFERCLKEKAPNIKIVAREDEQGKIDLTVNKTGGAPASPSEPQSDLWLLGRSVSGRCRRLKAARQSRQDNPRG